MKLQANFPPHKGKKPPPAMGATPGSFESMYAGKTAKKKGKKP